MELIDQAKKWVDSTFIRKRDLPFYEGSWTPTIGTTGAAPTTLTYTSQAGTYQRIGKMVFFRFSVTINAFTLGAGTGYYTVSLPFTVESTTYVPGVTYGVDLPDTPASVIFYPSGGNAHGRWMVTNDNAVAADIPLSALAAGDILAATGFYWAK